MTPKIAQGPYLKKVIHPLPLGSKTPLLKHYIQSYIFIFKSKLGESKHVSAQKTCVSRSQSFQKGPYHGRDAPSHTLPLGVQCITRATLKLPPPPTPQAHVLQLL